MYRIRHNIQVQEKKATSPISELLSLMFLISKIQVCHEGKYQVIDMEINPH